LGTEGIKKNKRRKTRHDKSGETVRDREVKGNKSKEGGDRGVRRGGTAGRGKGEKEGGGNRKYRLCVIFGSYSY